jgi:hypothetical protein
VSKIVPTAGQAADLERLKAQAPMTHTVHVVAQDYGRIVRECDRAAYDPLRDMAEPCGVAELRAVASLGNATDGHRMWGRPRGRDQ